MTAHVLYPSLDESLPATLSPYIIGDLLRGELGFQGLIVTDDLEMQAIVDHMSVEEAAVQAFKAGADLLLICKDRARITAAARRILSSETRRISSSSSQMIGNVMFPSGVRSPSARVS